MEDAIMKATLLKRELPLYGMLIVPVVLVFVYSYIPMVGFVMAFQDFVPYRQGFVYSLFHSEFIGLNVFKSLLHTPGVTSVIYNTFFISFLKIVAKLIFPLIFALLLNEITKSWFRKLATTITYLPFFLSWVVLGGILLDFFSPQDGAFNGFLKIMGIHHSTFFFGNAAQFPFAVVLSDLWKEIGYNTIIFLAALASVDPSMYEAAVIDGAGKWKQTLYLTIPSITPMIILVGILSLGNVLNAGQDQILNLYSPVVYSSGDIIDTFAFRQGIQQGQFSIATAVGLFKSLVSFTMISIAYLLANKLTSYKVF